MPVIRQMLGSWTELEANAWYVPASLISFLLLYTWFNRIPEAESFLRSVWRNGRWLLVIAYLWSFGVLLALHEAVLLRTDHRHFEAMLILLLIDSLAIGYLSGSRSVRRLFAEFPVVVDSAAERDAAKSKVEDRQQFAREVRLTTAIAQTPEQESREAYWRSEAAKHPATARPWIELGVLAYECGQTVQALTMLEQARDHEPQNLVVLRNLCELWRQKGRLQKAVDYGQQAVEQAPDDEIARLNLAQALVDDKQIERAISEYHRILDLNPQHTQTWMNLAVLLLQQERRADALVALDAVLLIESGNEQAKTLKKQLL